MFFWDSEHTNPIKRYWLAKMQFIFVWLGITGQWKMFSPNPSRQNSWLRVRFILLDGEIIVWEPVPVFNMSVTDKIKYKKFIKLYSEIVKIKVSGNIKRDFIEYLMRKKNIVLKCRKAEIYAISQEIPPPHARTETPLPVRLQLIYTFFPKNN